MGRPSTCLALSICHWPTFCSSGLLQHNKGTFDRMLAPGSLNAPNDRIMSQINLFTLESAKSWAFCYSNTTWNKVPTQG